MILIPREVEAIPLFMKYIKGESAHAINNILGRRKRTIWCQSYDCPVMLTASNVTKYIAYLYTNPEKDRIIDSIDNYTGVSSWRKFKHKNFDITANRIPRDCIMPQQDPGNITKSERATLARIYGTIKTDVNSFTLKPYDCLRCFPEFEDATDDEIHEAIAVAMTEERAGISKEQKPVHNRKTLQMVQIDLGYEPKKFGKKMVVLCDDIKERIDFLQWYRSICQEAREVYEKWKEFKFEVEWPKYLIPPAKPRARLDEPLFYPV